MLQTISISDFPNLPEIKRKVVIIGRNEDYENKRVTLLCRVEHYNQANERIHNLRAIERDPYLLVATSDTLVNPNTGAILLPDGEGNYPQDSMSEYDFLKAAIDAGANHNVLVEGAVLQADSFNRFN